MTTIRTFASMNGDFPNIGDAVIRRLALDWVRDPRGNCIYVAEAPDMWIRQIDATPADTVIRARGQFWRWAGMVLKAPRKSTLLLEPGEVILDRASLRRELGLLGIVLLFRLKGGRIILPPRAAVRPHGATLRVHRAICRLASVVLWRERESQRVVGQGSLSPDIGFSAGIRRGEDFESRRTLVVSLRGHRPEPNDTWCEAVRMFAQMHGLDIVTLSQVSLDEERNARLASRLGGTHIAWSEGGDLEHEAVVRDLYDHSKLVISDRLHVLIIASLSGAVPLELVAEPAPKVRVHFEQVGFRDASFDVCDVTSADIVSRLEQQATRADELRECVQKADAALSGVRAEIARARNLA